MPAVCGRCRYLFEKIWMDWPNHEQNDLSFFAKSSLSMYADDHKMFHFRNNQSSVTLELREIGRNVPYSYDSNLLAVNLKRYHAMNIGDSEDKTMWHTIWVNK